MKKIIINENEKGLLFRNGRFVKVLPAGKYTLWKGNEVEKLALNTNISSSKATLETLMADTDFARQATFLQLPDNTYAIHYVDGVYKSFIPRGKVAFWNDDGVHTFQLIDISDPWVKQDVPKHIFSRISSVYYHKVEVAQYQKARLYIDNKFEGLLEPGVYYFWKGGATVQADYVDTRLIQMDITGQEMLTSDKVSLRINFVANYRITDYVKIHTEIDDWRQQIYVAAQLALREYVGRHKLDDILENKDAMTQFVFDRLKAKEAEFYISFADAGVKDIILPGEIRQIMNTVLIAEKRAQANVITRREEVASTRSLLNTAKLMDENRTLYKLKELEYMEKICENVGNITLNAGGDIISRLQSLVRK